MNADIVVIGGGIVGSAIAYGLARRKVRVAVLDGSDRDVRAANANFGLVWLQGKGTNMPAYQRWTRKSIQLWPEFSAELTEATGIDLQYECDGGLTITLGEADFEKRRATIERLAEQLGDLEPDCHMIDRRELESVLPGVRLGSEVTGASYGRSDGHANPLRLLAALHAETVRNGGELLGGCAVQRIQRDASGSFLVDYGSGRVSAARVVIAAGLGSKELAAQVGLDIQIRPQRGQILVTERVEPFLPLPTSGLRQTREGTVMIGATMDEAGFDTSTTAEAAAALGAKAIRRVPALAGLNLVRQWAGLRILTPDRHPVYAESKSHPGAYVAVCHSGVTLAAVHAADIAHAFASGQLPASLNVFHHSRFDVSKAA
ncbi:FAD-dependent oxidoreductase [Devosia yakushimensis]|uniref:FAD-dependent oxidoreductase n=1 Tax=Devosia yakushimensis TaxID=470028 RepID=A0ABQ5UMW7_9HYPH|nr:FAD-dependent oxidoreductase [Devosia yakushimensis]GLQ12505.1 FAD-dependent oxidoreductase [Devosia yakushimensis]